MTPNHALEQTDGSHSLAAAAHRERWAAIMRRLKPKGVAVWYTLGA